MKRSAVLLKSSLDKKRHIYVDSEISSELTKYIQQDERHKKKFNHIVGIILGNYRIPDLYDKEDINDKCKDVTAMKLFKGQENDRIYCKELSGTSIGFVVVCCVLHQKKKTQKNSQKEISIIDSISKYEYEIRQ